MTKRNSQNWMSVIFFWYIYAYMQWNVCFGISTFSALHCTSPGCCTRTNCDSWHDGSVTCSQTTSPLALGLYLHSLLEVCRTSPEQFPPCWHSSAAGWTGVCTCPPSEVRVESTALARHHLVAQSPDAPRMPSSFEDGPLTISDRFCRIRISRWMLPMS